MLAKYNKTIVAVIGAVIAWVGAVIVSDSGPVTSAEWYAGVVAVATALGVYAVPNTDDHIDGGH